MFYLWVQLGCTVSRVTAERPVEHFKHTLQNIMTDRMLRSVQRYLEKPLSPNIRNAFTSGNLFLPDDEALFEGV